MFVNKVFTCFYIIIERVFVWFNAFFCEKGVIVMFHHVTNEELDEIPACLCKVERFKEIIDELRINYQIVSIDDIYEKTEKKKELGLILEQQIQEQAPTSLSLINEAMIAPTVKGFRNYTLV